MEEYRVIRMDDLRRYNLQVVSGNQCVIEKDDGKYVLFSDLKTFPLVESIGQRVLFAEKD